jgi:hypothetical protein
MTDVPVPNSYWVKPGAFLAGEYPGESHERFRAAGVNAFLDLTEAGEYGVPAYDDLLEGWATHRRFAIPDYGCPSVPDMSSILDEIDAALAGGRVLYVHCLGGAGRTGTVVACWLVRHGMNPDEALASIAESRRGTPEGHRPSPEAEKQVDMVRAWPVGR